MLTAVNKSSLLLVIVNNSCINLIIYLDELLLITTELHLHLYR